MDKIKKRDIKQKNKIQIRIKFSATLLTSFAFDKILNKNN